LAKVSPDPKIRAASNKVSGFLGKFSIETFARPEFYHALKDCEIIVK